jgi:hypothetical protein
MPLTLPDLDDRTYADLLEEARALIPVYAPEWTNHNESDPGITLIELFAYLTEMLIYRLNRITDAETLAFLTLINGPGWVPSGDLRQDKRLSVQTLRQPYRAVTCKDYEQLTLSGNDLVARATCVSRRNLSPGGEMICFLFPDQTATAAVSAINLNISKDKKLYIGSSENFNNILFSFSTKGQGYQLFFEYYDGSGDWLPFTKPTQIIDSTSDWTSDGFLEFNPPPTWEQVAVNSQTKFWIRVGTNSAPSTVATAMIAFDEADHLSLCIVPADTSFDNVFTTVDGVSYLDHTAKTRAERQISFSLDAGNEGTPFLYVGSLAVFNKIYFQLDDTAGSGYKLEFEYSSSGSNPWTPLTEQDQLVDGTKNLSASGLVTFNSPPTWTQAEVDGVTRYWIRGTSTSVPQTPAKAYHIARVQTQIDSLIEEVRTDLDDRRLLATRLHVIEPNYVEVRLQATLYIKPDAFEATVRTAVIKALQLFFDPLYGGRNKQGWPFGRNVYASEIYELLDQLTGVDYVDSVTFPNQAIKRSLTNTESTSAIKILPHELVAISVTEDDITISSSVQGQ